MSCSCHINPPCHYCAICYECEGCGKIRHPEEDGVNYICDQVLCDYCLPEDDRNS